ncbi:MAG: hypothetical protein IT450_11150 [Phycisphaerales bacterium]|nr:hypothetical protein [Phycisphaerales bacterium]
MMRLSLRFVSALVVGLSGAMPALADIVLGTGFVTSRTYDGTVATSDAYVQISPTGTVTATRPGGNYSMTEYSVTSDSFDFGFSHGRVGSYQSSSESVVFIPFRPDTDVVYQLSGDYGLRALDAGRLYLALDLYDSTTNQLLFRQISESRRTNGESYSLGTPGGDYSHFVSGVIHGTLLAGHQYLLSFQLRTHAFLGQDSGALTTGNLTLDFIQVPTPGAAGLGAIGVVALALFRQKTARRPC